jgi:hypothetical protein
LTPTRAAAGRVHVRRYSDIRKRGKNRLPVGNRNSQFFIFNRQKIHILPRSKKNKKEGFCAFL